MKQLFCIEMYVRSRDSCYFYPSLVKAAGRLLAWFRTEYLYCHYATSSVQEVQRHRYIKHKTIKAAEINEIKRGNVRTAYTEHRLLLMSAVALWI